MPYSVRQTSNGQWTVVKKSTGKVLGTHTSMEKAKKQMAAIHANEHKKG